VTPPVGREVRQDVLEVLVRYATGIDRRDWALFRSCFAEDCEADYGDIGVWRSADEITAFMEQTHAGRGHALHRVTNGTITPSTDGVSARCYADAIVRGADNMNGANAIGYYDDELTATDGGWKIARRRLTMVKFEMIGDAVATMEG
jgi:SnoaL-like domain